MICAVGPCDRRDEKTTLCIEHSLRWHDPDRFNGYDLSPTRAGTPVDAATLGDATAAVKEGAPGLLLRRASLWSSWA